LRYYEKIFVILHLNMNLRKMNITLMKVAVAVAACMSTSVAASADSNIPAGYYSSLNGKSGADLKTAICNLVYNHTQVSSYNNLPNYFQRTDVYPDGSSRWWDMYSDIPLYAPSFNGLNREHAFPKSWWGGSTDTPAYVDLFHLYPSEEKANMAKSNYPLGEVDRTLATFFDNGITTVGYAVSGQGGGAKYVFEPADEYKGDFARTYFYMVCCYQNLTWSYTYMVGNNLYPTLNSWSQQLLMKWAKEDQVSQKEIDRNQQVYYIQANRNPFIDLPTLADYLWGDKRGEIFYVSENEGGTTGDPTLITPVQGMELEFPQVALGNSSSAKLHLAGESLTGQNLTLTIYDNDTTTDAEMFNIDGQPRQRVSVSSVNSEDGLWVTVNYVPTSVGTHTTRLVISGGGLTGSVGIGLYGQCFERPTLTAPTAIAPSDITSTSYVANWQPVEGEVVDYYVVNRTRYEGGSASTEQLYAEDNYLLIEDFTGQESYTVKSVRLGVYSPQSNVVFVSTTSISGVQAPEALGVRQAPGGVLLTCADTVANLRVVDMSGRVILSLPEAHNSQIIALPQGIYVISADGISAPVRVIVE
jgi:endonuclease I